MASTQVLDRHDTALRAAAVLFAVGFIVHTADHLRRGLDAVTPQVLWAGNLSSLLIVGTVALVLTRHRLAPQVATIAGYAIGFGVSAVHLAPSWGAFSDSLPSGHLDTWTWIAVLLEITGAFAVAVAGSRAWAAAR